jgi:DHA1 family bicyclomycin/chloramphenicol resistance-like MFS transporter
VLTGLGALSMNIFLPSLPAMTEHFETDYRLMQLSVALYLAVNAVLQIVVGPISDRYGRRPVLLWGSRSSFSPRWAASRPHGRGLPRLPHAAGGCRGGPRARPRRGARHVSRRPGRQPDRLCHDGHGRGADDRPGHRRRARRNPRLAGEFLDAGDPRGARPRPRLARPGRNRRHADRPASPSNSANTPSCSPRAASGATASAPAFASGAFFAYLGGAPYVGSEVFGLSAGEVGLYFGAPALGYFFGNWLSGRYSVPVGINGMILWGTILSAAGLPCRSCCSSIGLKTRSSSSAS